LGQIYTADTVNLFPSSLEQDHNTGLPSNALGRERLHGHMARRVIS